ncbi:uncharacterized protein LOC111271482 isoform X4 [Varroa jacobsoni]|nr:uncharacterized protein LOC111271482 isoform X4 [Varroa jacobsoni]XP_022708042.1 uncharacterized protein LOC111271482 isoform X4 [Varroa jacobsoni]
MSAKNLSRPLQRQLSVSNDGWEKCARCNESDFTCSHLPRQMLNDLSCGADRHRESNASKVSFHNVFGDLDDDVTSLQDKTTDQITVIHNEGDSRRNFFSMEHVLILYATASAFLRVNLLQVFRIKECLEDGWVKLDDCEEFQREGFLRQGQINAWANDMLLIRDVLHYTFGAILAFLCCQYMNKYGLRHLLYACLLGTWLTTVLALMSFFLPGTQIYFSFLAILPAVLSGGDIVMMTLTSVEIATSSTGNRLCWRFFIYEFIVFVSELFPKLLDLYVLPTVFEVELNAAPTCLIMIAILISSTLPLKDFPAKFNEHTMIQRVRCAFGLVGLQQTLMCFTRQRECKGRRQLIMIIFMFATPSTYIGVFSSLRMYFLGQVYGWDAYMFTSVSSTAMGGCFIVGTLVMAVLTRRTRLFDLLVVFVGYACLTLSYVAIALSQFNIFAYYAALSLQLAPVIGSVYLRSHLCLLLESFEFAPVFSAICIIQRALPLLANSLLKMFVTSAMFSSCPFSIFLILAGIFIVPTFTSLYIYSVTRSRSYVAHQRHPTVNSNTP